MNTANIFKLGGVGGIILDAPDQFGKTTLAEKLSKLTGMEIVHFKHNNEVDQVEYYTRPAVDGVCIIDRNYVSELVYGQTLRGKSVIDESMKDKIEELLHKNNYFIVILDRKNYIWEERAEMFTKDDNERVIAGYKKIYDDISIDKMRVDAFDDDTVNAIYQHWLEKNKLWNGFRFD